jgi:hypothetical protein
MLVLYTCMYVCVVPVSELQVLLVEMVHVVQHVVRSTYIFIYFKK